MTSFHCHSNLKYVYARVAARGLSVFPARRNSIKVIFGFVKRLRKWLENSPELYFSHFNVLPLDERSLIGSKKLVSIWITSRYTGISDKSLRGIHIVVFLGDDVRLPPVLDNLVYLSNNKSKETYKESSASRTFNQLLHL